MSKITRQNFIKGSVASALSLSVMSASVLNGKKKTKLNIGIIGVGTRGLWHLKLALDRNDVNVMSICDIDQKTLNEAKKIINKSGKKMPRIYDKNEFDYLNLLKEEGLDAVIIATPWRLHVPMAIASMKAKLYTGLEVSGLASIEECWNLVNVQEETGSELFFLENVCYRRDVMAVMNMVKKGLFGELIHMEGGYQHDLRHVKFNDGITPYGKGAEFNEKGYSEARWRTQHSVGRNGDLYPTHGVGPVAMMLGIERGNRFVSLTSTATKARGLHNYIKEVGGESHPNTKVKFNLGDVVTTVIKTQNNETITLNHDTNLPRPYSLGFRVQGTKGIWMDVNDSIYIEGMSPKSHRWESFEKYQKEYDHPLWKRYTKEAEGGGHGGMDWFLMNSFVEHAKRNKRAAIDVYDAAAWSAITPLSEKSIALGSHPVYFPDFSKGRWIKRKNRFATSDEF